MALTEPVESSNILYLSIVAGIFREKTTEGTPGAVRRDYMYKDEPQTKWEKLHKNLRGFLRGIEFNDSDFGEQCSVTIENEGKIAKLQLGTNSRYFTDFAKKITTCQVDEEITLQPFDFTSKEGKQITGVTIMQGAGKLGSRYWDGKKSINGAPSPDGDVAEYTSDDWKIFFLRERRFLVNELKEFSTLIEPIVTGAEAHYTPVEDLFPGKPRPKSSAPDLDSQGIENIVRG